MKFCSINVIASGMLAAVIAVALILRIECARDELWIDEYITAWTVSGTWETAWQRSEIAHQAPLYTTLIFAVTRFVGLSDLALRSPSLLAGMLLVALCSLLAWQLTRLRSAAILAAVWSAVDPSFVFYASEARPYAIVQLLGAIGASCVWQWFSLAKKSDNIATVSRPWVAGLLVASTAAFYFHFTSLISSAVQFAFGLTTALRLGIGRRKWVAAILLFAALSIAGLVALWKIYPQVGEWRDVSSISGLTRSLQSSFLIYVIPALLGLGGAIINLRIRRSADWHGILLLLSISVATIGAVALLTGFGIAPLAHYRYVIASTGTLPAVGTCVLVIFSSAQTRGLVAAALVILAWTQTALEINPFLGSIQPPMRWERWSAIVERINDESGNDALPVIVFPNLIEDSRIGADAFRGHETYFWAPLDVLNRPAHGNSVWARPTWSNPRFDSMSIGQIERAGGAWLVIRGGVPELDESPTYLETAIVGDLESRLAKRGHQTQFGRFGPTQSTVQLWRVKITGDD